MSALPGDEDLAVAVPGQARPASLAGPSAEPATEPCSEPAPEPAGYGLAVGVLKAMRPRQWLKNGLVLAAPFFAGRLGDATVFGQLGVAFAVFCLIASGVYLINDVRDREMDRRHPVKRFRPIAAGVVPVRLGVAMGPTLIVAGLGLAAAGSTRQLVIAAAAYVAISTAYNFALKDQPVVDLVVIASGFLLRAMAGGLATGIPLSQWFLLVASFGALFVAAGKRYSELVTVGERVAVTRKSLASYSASYLRFLWGTAASVTITAYSLWAFEVNRRTGSTCVVVSIAPFVLGLLRYAVDVDSAKAGAPEDIAFGDRVLQVVGVSWLALIIIGIGIGT